VNVCARCESGRFAVMMGGEMMGKWWLKLYNGDSGGDGDGGGEQLEGQKVWVPWNPDPQNGVSDARALAS